MLHNAEAWIGSKEKVPSRQVVIELAEWSEGDRVIPKYHLWFDKALRCFCARHDLPHRGNHAFRHSFASVALIRYRWSLPVLAKWLGHDQSVCFRLYAHMIPDDPPDFSY